MRSLRHYHMGCGETLLSTGWLALEQKRVKAMHKSSHNTATLKKTVKKKL